LFKVDVTVEKVASLLLMVSRKTLNNRPENESAARKKDKSIYDEANAGNFHAIDFCALTYAWRIVQP
jgi:hypothetical protein